MRSHDSEGKKSRMYVSQHDLELWVKDIVDHLIVSGTFPTYILAIGRGGLIPAAMIAYMFGCKTGTYPSFECLNVTSYSNEKKGTLRIHGTPQNLLTGGLRTLIIDDIADSGATLEALKGMLPYALTATLVHKETSSIKPDFCGHTDKDGDKYWYVFPWELER